MRTIHQFTALTKMMKLPLSNCLRAVMLVERKGNVTHREAHNHFTSVIVLHDGVVFTYDPSECFATTTEVFLSFDGIALAKCAKDIGTLKVEY